MKRNRTGIFDSITNLFYRDSKDYRLIRLETERQHNSLIEQFEKQRESFKKSIRQIDEMRGWFDYCSSVMRLGRAVGWIIDWEEEKEYWLSEAPCLPVSLGKYLKK